MSIIKKIVFVVVILLGLCLVVYFIGNNLQKHEEEAAKKPVIYLYPQEQQEVFVEVKYNGKFTCTYPEYKDGWSVTADPDGTLLNHRDQKEYSYLYWEGKDNYSWDLSTGFVVKGDETAEFLQEKLAFLGLTPREYNEFIVYWLPEMQNNKYNLIHFATKEYEELAQLKILPEPDTILRVFMVYKPLDRYQKIEEQVLETTKRDGFTVVEWGGTNIEE